MGDENHAEAKKLADVLLQSPSPADRLAASLVYGRILIDKKPGSATAEAADLLAVLYLKRQDKAAAPMGLLKILHGLLLALSLARILVK